MNIQKIIDKLEKEIKHLFHEESGGHDLNHLKRVLNLALTIQEKEGGDKLIIAVSAFLHDIHRMIQKETGKYCYPKESLPRVKEILDKIDLTEKQKSKILHCVEFHEEYNFSVEGKKVTDIETLILQDADNLDAIGAIGVGRTFAYCGAHGLSMWIPEEPFHTGKYDESKHDPSAIHHIHSKLLKLKNDMNTKTAKLMAEKRHEFMESFAQEFFKEWKGEK